MGRLDLLDHAIISRITEFLSQKSRNALRLTSRQLHWNSKYIFDRELFRTFVVTISEDGINKAKSKLEDKRSIHIKSLHIIVPSKRDLRPIKMCNETSNILRLALENASQLRRIIYENKGTLSGLQLMHFSNEICECDSAKSFKLRYSGIMVSQIDILIAAHKENNQQLLQRIYALDFAFKGFDRYDYGSMIREFFSYTTALEYLTFTIKESRERPIIERILKFMELTTLKSLKILTIIAPKSLQEEVTNYNTQFSNIQLRFN